MGQTSISVILILFLSFLSSCDTSRSKTADDTGVNPNGSGICIPESKLTGIVGGSKILPGAYDDKIVMMLNIPKGEDLGICTATAIAPDVLLTAGHCVDGDLEHAFVTLHTSLSCESGFDFRYDTVKISSFAVNEDFDLELAESNPPKMKGDIALVFLKEPLPARYPIYKIARPEDFSKSNQIYFYGYGSVGYEKKGSAILRKTALALSNVTVDIEQKKVFVNQSDGTGICTGDSGGPGLLKINGEYQILGVNSYVEAISGIGDLCQGKSALVLVDAYRNWIEEKLRSRGRLLRP